MSNQRTAYGEELLALGGRDSRIVVLDADLSKSAMSSLFEAAYPERHFEMGIAEANMTSFAAGLSLTGKVAFTNSFAVFAAGRAYDQIRQGIAIARLNVKICGTSAGLSDFGDGATHQSVEDIAIMTAIPNMTVLVPADGPEVKRMVRWAAAFDGPVYLRIARNDCADITPEGASVLAPYLLRPGSDVCLAGCGIMTAQCLAAAEELAAEGVSARVVHVPCLKPFDAEAFFSLASGTRALVSAEEHSRIGGLASTMAYALRGDGRKMGVVAIDDCFGQSAPDAASLLAHYALTSGRIAQEARAALA